MVATYTKVCKMDKIRDITNAKDNDGVKDRSGASTIIKREVTTFDQSILDIIECEYPPFRLKNKNGGDIYIYPCHLVIID
jgi:hypothetical protein